MNLLQWLVLPYTRRELPGWGRAFHAFVGDYRSDPLWSREPKRTIKGRLHGYEMELNLARWSERLTFFLGRFYDLPTQAALIEVLRPGDRFVDVGANIGMITLLASKLVGPSGVIDAFEPNPRNLDRIAGFLAANRIENVRVHPAGLGDVAAKLALTVPRYNTGEGTFTAVAGADADRFESFEVDVFTGDEALRADPRPPALIKIDVEGFERHVLSGLRGTLETARPIVTTEMQPEHLARAGHSTTDLFNLMSGLGYRAYRMETKGAGSRPRLILRPAGPDDGEYDALWAHPDAPTTQRIAHLLP